MLFSALTRLTRISTKKAIVEGLRQDRYLYLKMSIAESLSKTLNELETMMTDEEIRLWSAFYQIKNEDEKAAMDKAKKGRRGR